MHVFIFLSLSITQAFHSFLSFLSFAPKIHGGGLQFLCLSPPWCLTPPLLWWGSTQPPWIGILARTIFAAIVNTPLSYYLWNFGTNDKFSPPPSNPGVENLSTWISDTWSSGTYMSQNSTCQKSTCWDSVLPSLALANLDKQTRCIIWTNKVQNGAIKTQKSIGKP